MDPDVVAIINGQPLSKKELIDRISFLKNKGMDVTPEVVKNVVDHLIDERLVTQEAYRIGLDKDPEIEKDLRRWIKIQSIIRLRDELIKEQAKLTPLDEKKLRQIPAAFLRDLKKKAKIKIDEDLLRSIDADRLAEKGKGFYDDRVLAWVNDEPITVGDFLRRYRGDLPHLRYARMPAEEKKRRTLDNVISFTLEAQAAMARNYYGRMPELRRLALRHKERVMRAMLYDKVILNEINPSKDELMDFYRENIKMFSTSEKVTLKGIILPDSSKAEKILEELKMGADFDYLASSFSRSLPQTYRERWIEVWRLPKNVRKSIEKLDIGDVSDVLDVKEGAIIVKLTGREEGKPLPFAMVEQRVKKMYLRRKGRGVIKAWKKRLRERSKVRINDSMLKGIKVP